MYNILCFLKFQDHTDENKNRHSISTGYIACFSEKQVCELSMFPKYMQTVQFHDHLFVTNYLQLYEW